MPEGPELALETPEPKPSRPAALGPATARHATASSRAAHHLLRHGRGDLIRELRRPGEHEETAQQAAEGRGEPERHGRPAESRREHAPCQPPDWAPAAAQATLAPRAVASLRDRGAEAHLLFTD